MKVNIARFNNPELEKKVMSELVVLKHIPFDFPTEPVVQRNKQSKRRGTISDNAAGPAKKLKTGKDNEIQGALALIELAHN